MAKFTVGDRVKISPEKADGYHQPWRDRFKNGREGTVTGVDQSALCYRIMVLWDHKRGSNASFTLRMSVDEVVKIPQTT